MPKPLDYAELEAAALKLWTDLALHWHTGSRGADRTMIRNALTAIATRAFEQAVDWPLWYTDSGYVCATDSTKLLSDALAALKKPEDADG